MKTFENGLCEVVVWAGKGLYYIQRIHRNGKVIRMVSTTQIGEMHFSSQKVVRKYNFDELNILLLNR